MSPWSIPVRRPMATSMFFLGIVLLGLIAWQRMPVELMPPIGGDELFVSYFRPGGTPELVEREILQSLESRVRELREVEETWGEITGSSGTFRIRFSPGADMKTRELELRRVASQLAREQPPGSSVEVSSQDFSAISRFVMFVQVLGMDDRNSLLDLVEDRIVPRLAAVPGVSRVTAGGGAPREVTVWIDPDRAAAAGVVPDQVVGALARSVRRLDYLGGVEDAAGRTAVVLDGRPEGVVSLANMRVASDRPVLLRHVAEVEEGFGREETLFRVNGEATVGLVVFKDENANLIRLGEEMRARLDDLRREYAPYGLDFVMNFDAAEVVAEQLDRLKRLAGSGFLIALVVLFVFLRQWRAVAVVAVAVPASLLAALALLYLAGQSLNVISLFGLAVAIGMLVDNSIVVYEAVQRQLERGAEADDAAVDGVRRTVRAMIAATVTNALPFLPLVFLDFGDAFVRALLVVVALAMLLPLAGSLLVALGLVPLLARRLAAPAAMRRLATLRRRRERLGGLVEPDRARELFGGVLAVTLRRPAIWLTAVVAAVLLTVIIALPGIAVTTSGSEPAEADQVRFSVDLVSGSTQERAQAVFERLEESVAGLEGIELVESVVREDGGAVTVHLMPPDVRPDDVSPRRVRERLQRAAEQIEEVDIDAQSSVGGGGGGLDQVLGQGPAEVVLSGPDARQLETLAREIVGRLESISEVSAPGLATDRAQDELRVLPDERALDATGLTPDQVLPALSVLRREGVALRVGFTLKDGREVPLTVRREEKRRGGGGDDLRRLRLSTPAGVLPLAALADVRRMPPPPAIQHHDGRRELRVTYSLSENAPATGPARIELEREIRAAIQQVHRPPGYTIEAPQADEGFDWFKRVLVPVLLLLYAALAVTFESLTLPLLVLVALPLTVLGATWALLLAGMPADTMALVGALALIGLTVNPAILLVDRMQQRAWVGGRSAGAAALAAVRERARPVMMTATTTIAALWPLALVTGEENELWPPFATIVMGGLGASTLLTLLVIPVGFVFLHRLDRLFGRLGPWIVLGWAGGTAAVMGPLIALDLITSMTWQIITTLLVAALLLGVIVWLIRRPALPEPQREDGRPPIVEVRHLDKTYGRPGPVGRAWRAGERFAEQVRRRGANPFDPQQARERLLPLVIVLSGALYLTVSVQTIFWRLVLSLVAAALAAAALRQVRRARGLADELGRVKPGGAENLLAALAPWVALGWLANRDHLLPRLADDPVRLPLWVAITLAVLLAVTQLGRRTAVRLARGQIAEQLGENRRLRRPRSLWRWLARRTFGLDLPREQVHAVRGVHFEARRGMIGILGPNGAGKTTLLRQLAGILEPSVGTIHIGGVRLEVLRRHLARWIGYLPQDFGLPNGLTAREYLMYYALLYEIPVAERGERVQRLLDEVGLGQRADDRIGGFSGGMRQRVAVARTLLRLPPVIIVDEPTVGLDPRERIRFRNLLARLAEGRIVFFSTHVVEDVAVTCERVIVMARGRKVFDGEPMHLSAHAQGKVWQVRLPAGAEERLPQGARVIDRVPEAAGTVRARVLSATRPHESALELAPTLEDGYFWLAGSGALA